MEGLSEEVTWDADLSQRSPSVKINSSNKCQDPGASALLLLLYEDGTSLLMSLSAPTLAF